MKSDKVCSLCLIIFLGLSPCLLKGQNTSLDSLKLTLFQETNDSLKAEILAEIGDSYYEENFDSTIHYYNLAYSFSESIPYYSIQLSSLRSLGYVYSFRKNDFKAALIFFNKAADLAKSESDTVAIAYVLSDIGRIHWKQGKSFEAFECHLQVKSIGEQINNAKVQLRSNLSLGIIENEEGNNDKAKKYYNRALFLADSLKKDRMKGLILNNLGKASQDEKEFEKAYEYFELADSVFTGLNDNGRLSLVHSNLGENYNLQEAPELGIKHFNLALEFNKKIENKEREVMILAGLALAHQKMNKIELSISTAEKALSLLNDVDTDLYYDKLYKILGENYELVGNHLKSLENYKQHFESKTVIDEVTQTKKIADLKHLYEIGKKQNQILELKTNDLEKEKKIERSGRYLQRMGFAFFFFLLLSILVFYRLKLKEVQNFDKLRNRLSNDLHDNIGASLNHIKLLSNRMGRKRLSEQEQENTVVKIKNISNDLIYNMHDMVWALDKNKESIGSLLERMQDHADNTLSDFNIPFNFDIEAIDESIILSTDKKINIYLIFKESINNILKHTETERVIITFSKGENKFLEILISNFYSTKKETEIASNNKGILNMKNRAKEIGGRLMVSDENNNFKIKLSI